MAIVINILLWLGTLVGALFFGVAIFLQKQAPYRCMNIRMILFPTVLLPLAVMVWTGPVHWLYPVLALVVAGSLTGLQSLFPPRPDIPGMLQDAAQHADSGNHCEALRHFLFAESQCVDGGDPRSPHRAEALQGAIVAAKNLGNKELAAKYQQELKDLKGAA